MPGPAKFKDWKERRYWEQGVDTAPDSFVWIDDKWSKEQGIKKHYSDYYDKTRIERTIEHAIKNGVDPYLALGVTLSETGIGNKIDDNNIMRINYDAHKLSGDEWIGSEFSNKWKAINQSGYSNSLLPEHMQASPEMFADDIRQSEIEQDKANLDWHIDYGVKYLKKQLDTYSNLETAVQAYSGTGEIPYGGKNGKRYFGKEIGDMNLWGTQDQAKRAVGFSKMLKKDESIRSIVDETKNRMKEMEQ